MSQVVQPGSARYHIFVLSIWEEGSRSRDEKPSWRFSLEGAQTAGRKGFTNLDDLTAYLEAWVQMSPGGSLSASPVYQSTDQELTVPMSFNRSSATPVALMSGSGETHSINDTTVTFKTTGRESDGQFAVLEVTEPPGSGSPTQWHKVTTVLIYVLEGTLTLRVGNETIQAGPGGYAYMPPGTVYAIANRRDASARYLSVQSPAWIENYFAEGIALVNNEPSWPPADMSKFLAMRAKYDVYDPPVS